MSSRAADFRLSALYKTLKTLAQREDPRDLKDVGASLKELQRGLTGDRRLAGRSYFSTPEFLGVYLRYYWPISFVQTFLALSEIEARGFLPSGAAVLDLGAGPGPGSFAALAKGARSCLLLDRSAGALDMASRLVDFVLREEGGGPALFSTELLDLEKANPLPVGPFELVLACHSVNELWKGRPDARDPRLALLKEALRRLNPGGLLLVIEPSAAVTAIPALELRDALLASAVENDMGGLSCVAPCPSSDPCPIIGAGEGRSCHSTWDWDPLPEVAALAAAAGLDRDSVKATWFALRKGPSTRSLASEVAGLAGGNGTGRAIVGREGGDGASLSGRIVSEPLLNKARRIRYLVCEGPRLATFSAPGDSAEARASGFLGLRRGDLFLAEGLERRPGERSFGLLPGSRLQVRLKAPEAGS